MEKLLEIRIGEGRVQSGLLPLDAIDLMDSLMAALAEEGADPAILKKSNPHIKIVAENSTRAALYTEHVPQLRKPLSAFRRNARGFTLGPRGREFAGKATLPTATWGYVEIIETSTRQAKVLRFDAHYRERLERRSKSQRIEGSDEVYARIVRAGGDLPTVKLQFMSGESDTVRVSTRELAKRLAADLYEVVKLKADVVWDRKTLEVVSMTVVDIDEDWQDVHLGSLVELNNGRLPVDLTIGSVENLLEGRRIANEEDE